MIRGRLHLFLQLLALASAFAAPLHSAWGCNDEFKTHGSLPPDRIEFTATPDRELGLQALSVFEDATHVDAASGAAKAMQHVIEHSSLFFVRDGERVLGFTALERTDHHPFLEDTSFAHAQVNYFSAGMVRSEVQGGGMYKSLARARLDFLLDDETNPLIVVRTQNPKVIKTMIKSFKALQESGRISSYDLALKKIMHGAYGSRLTVERLSLEDPIVAEYFEGVDPDAGDALVLVFKLTEPQGAH